MQPRIAIIGAGPGGLTLARILHLNDIRAEVFEREPSSNSRSQGFSLDLHADSGQTALRAAQLTAEFQQIARYEDQESRVYDQHANLLLHETDTTEKDRPEVDRGHLRQMLLDSVPADQIHWNYALTAVQAHDDTTSTLTFQHQPSQIFDLVVGADGAWSRVRPLLSDARPLYSGILFVEFGIEAADRRHPALAEMVGRGLTFAVGDARAIIAHRDADAHLGIYAALRAPVEWLTDGTFDQSSPQALKQSIATHFEGWSPKLLALIHEAGEAIAPRPIYSLPVGHHWPNRPGITLLGDAAHLMSPFGGDGANLAMLDAADLGQALAEALTQPDWQSDVAAYETTMQKRAEQSAGPAGEAIQQVFSPDGLDHILGQLNAHRAS